MPITQWMLLKIPSFFLGFMIVGGVTAFSVLGLMVVRRFISHDQLKPHHDVADPILGALGAVYAVLIAFIVVTVWQNFDKSSANVGLEANYLADLYHDAQAFAPDFRNSLQKELREYARTVVMDEWKTMSRGQTSLSAERLMRKIWSLYTTYQPKNTTEQTFFSESVRKLNEFRELRRQRLMDARTGIHPLLWFVLIMGGAATISFTFLFGARNLKAQMVMGVLFSMTIALILFTILSLDFPFTGSVCVSPESFQMLLLD